MVGRAVRCSIRDRRRADRPLTAPPPLGQERIVAPRAPTDVQEAREAADHGHVPQSLACLAVVPIYLRTPEDLDVLLRALVSLRETAPQADVLVVDDCSPASELVDLIAVACERARRSSCTAARSTAASRARSTSGCAARSTRAATRCSSTPTSSSTSTAGWSRCSSAPTRRARSPPSSARGCCTPTACSSTPASTTRRCIASGRHRYAFGPADLPEALQPCRCPVTGALQLIRHECLAEVGLYDEALPDGLGGRRLLPARLRRRPRVHLRARRLRDARRVAVSLAHRRRPGRLGAASPGGPCARSTPATDLSAFMPEYE